MRFTGIFATLVALLVGAAGCGNYNYGNGGYGGGTGGTGAGYAGGTGGSGGTGGTAGAGGAGGSGGYGPSYPGTSGIVDPNGHDLYFIDGALFRADETGNLRPVTIEADGTVLEL